MSRDIEFWFDFSSPYGYFASLQIEDLAERHDRAVLWRPFLLGAAFQQTGMKPFDSTPIRGTYALYDWARLARKFKVSFDPARFRPIATLAAGRAYYAIEQSNADQAVALSKALFKSFFEENLDIGSPENVAEVGRRVGVDFQELRDQLDSPAIKALFRAKTDEAIKRGVFGSPFFFVDDEPFWGSDRIHEISEWLTKGGW